MEIVYSLGHWLTVAVAPIPLVFKGQSHPMAPWTLANPLIQGFRYPWCGTGSMLVLCHARLRRLICRLRRLELRFRADPHGTGGPFLEPDPRVSRGGVYR